MVEGKEKKSRGGTKTQLKDKKTRERRKIIKDIG